MLHVGGASIKKSKSYDMLMYGGIFLSLHARGL